MHKTHILFFDVDTLRFFSTTKRDQMGCPTGQLKKLRARIAPGDRLICLLKGGAGIRIAACMTVTGDVFPGTAPLFGPRSGAFGARIPVQTDALALPPHVVSLTQEEIAQTTLHRKALRSTHYGKSLGAQLRGPHGLPVQLTEEDAEIFWNAMNRSAGPKTPNRESDQTFQPHEIATEPLQQSGGIVLRIHVEYGMEFRVTVDVTPRQGDAA